MSKKSVYIETFGCQMNVADSERAATGLRSAGYELVDSSGEADVVLYNTCSVREKAERKVFHRIEDARRAAGREPLIGVMGCVAQLEGPAVFGRAPGVRMVIGTGAAGRIPELLERLAGGEERVLDLEGRGAGEAWDVSPAERHSEYVAFVPVIEGCNKFCTYCIVPYSRGRERSRPASEIVGEVKRLLGLGYREVQLIGQNVNSYRPGSDEGLEKFYGATPFSRLLRAVAATGMPRVKFTTSFPRDFHRDIVSALEENENLCNWVHLPVQSGSDAVLRAMRRGHKIEDYLKHVDVIKSARRKISLTSDIIVGFPGETAEDFEDTLKLVGRCGFEGLYIFKYSERRGTPAARLEDSVSAGEKAERFEALERLQEGFQEGVYKSYVGTEVSVLVEGASARSPEDMSGHTTCNKVVNFRGGPELLGGLSKVRVTEAKPHSLYGEFAGAA